LAHPTECDVEKMICCCTCKELLPVTEEHWFPSLIKKFESNPNRTGIGKCKTCATQYGANYNKKLKDQQLSRSRRELPTHHSGKLYIIGPKKKLKNSPYKIGIVSGTSIKKRLVALQTGHWLDLEIAYESPVIPAVRKIEYTLHEKYKTRRIRGEWFKITESDINDIRKQIQKT
jgi:hypothetical protein